MHIFISSLITGFETQRAAARRAVTTLRHEAVMAEDFGAQPSSPQVACLQGLRRSDMMVLILGEHYGFVPPGSTLSATHQEYREARETKPILAFVQEGITPSREQAAFIAEVQAWEGGLFRGGFIAANDLHDGVIRALHDVTLANATAPVDEQEMIGRALAMLPPESRNNVSSAMLELAVVGGPRQRILRPAELEAQSLAEHFEQSALYGDSRLFDRSLGAWSGLEGNDLVLRQDRGASIRLTEEGSVVLRVPLDDPRPRGQGFDAMSHMVVVEEVVQQRLGTVIGYAASMLEQVDPTQRLTNLAVAARLTGVEHRGWRTQAQNASNPSSVQIGFGGSHERPPVMLSIRRAALGLDRAALIEDILIPLRRQFPSAA
ncbi:MAG: DUF4062 domain-containing protein [Sphingopyxis sp.]|uniref:DUF4062 domain-containing protein n=1 Tax=Bosea sp. (in: a-proteobacteria) TaxID=1871050 RepID=UPI0012263177|nr:DUF4062 domain-containing protein [Bosea sp. (in: a-proteobacteria)]MBJ7441262.1 DUF4062 domain-containing protein [Sphingopyxis sp.]TAJ29244.1 MAG: DUF4062 domain-containing protein [Bosea sp. (in: a-proteobacteria)]